MSTIILSLFTTILFTSSLSAKEKVKVALVQSSFEWGDVEANIRNISNKLQNISGCDLIVLPELFLSGCDMRKKSKEESRRSKDRVAAHYETAIEKMRLWAKQTDAVIIGSTIYKEDNSYYNRLLAIYPSGEYKTYDKHNCFKRGSFTAGNKHLVIEVKGHRYATYICYDLRFPEWSKNNDRYDTAIYIANWTETTGEDWNNLLRERAIENEAHVIGVNCIGTDKAGKIYMGDSQVVSPEGKVLAKCQSKKEENLIVTF